MSEPRKIYIIQPTIRDKDGNYIPCIVVENETGFYRTDWEWGNDWDEANMIAERMNEKLGITKQEAYNILLSSQRLSLRARS